MNKEILIIDDELPLAEEWKTALEGASYKVTIVTGMSGVEQLRRLVQNPALCLVLLDVMMPVDESGGIPVDEVQYGRTLGVWIAERIAELAPAPPVIAVTVVTDESIIGKLRSHGVKRVLSKPFTNKELLDAVRSITDVASSGRESSG